MTNNYRVLLYYLYIDVPDPQQLREEQWNFCQAHDLAGRIIVSHEGINGTLSGTIDQTQAYIDMMNGHPLFATMQFKQDPVSNHAFRKLSVKVRKELVTLNLEDDISPLMLTGHHLSPKAFHEQLKQENVVVIDARNNYEYDLGHFQNAIKPEIQNFRELPEWIRNNRELLEDKKILTYCTGGVRCEKFSGWLLREGFEDVNQLDGGITTYGYDPEVQGEYWDGLMYVFDERISVPVNRKEHRVVGRDYFTGEPCERYVNCANPSCNRQMLCTVENEHRYQRSCCDACRNATDNRYQIENTL